jgi:periplasmic nitrate reductase NapE
MRGSGHEENGMSAMADGLRFQCSDLHMTDHSNKIEPVRSSVQRPRDELIVFLIIVALVWPIMTVGVVGGYGFAVWMYQLVAGPPGPPRR